jgi:hypothetical protein
MEAEPSHAPPKRKRRWFQFSFRSLLIFTLIVAIPCAWLGRRIARNRLERDAVEAIKTSGGKAWYDYEIRSFERDYRRTWSAPPEMPTGPKWLRNLLGEDFFSDVLEVRLTDASAGHLDWVDSLPQLETLDLSRTNATDADLARLAPLNRLKSLQLQRTKVTNAGLVHLMSLTKLQFLNLCATHVSDAGLSELRHFAQLRALALCSTNVSDDGIESLQRALPNCVMSN